MAKQKILILGGSGFVSQELALQMVKTFVRTDFEGGRHGRRVNKIACS